MNVVTIITDKQRLKRSEKGSLNTTKSHSLELMAAVIDDEEQLSITQTLPSQLLLGSENQLPTSIIKPFVTPPYRPYNQFPINNNNNNNSSDNNNENKEINPNEIYPTSNHNQTETSLLTKYPSSSERTMRELVKFDNETGQVDIYGEAKRVVLRRDRSVDSPIVYVFYDRGAVVWGFEEGGGDIEQNGVGVGAGVNDDRKEWLHVYSPPNVGFVQSKCFEKIDEEGDNYSGRVQTPFDRFFTFPVKFHLGPDLAIFRTSNILITVPYIAYMFTFPAIYPAFHHSTVVVTVLYVACIVFLWITGTSDPGVLRKRADKDFNDVLDVPNEVKEYLNWWDAKNSQDNSLTITDSTDTTSATLLSSNSQQPYPPTPPTTKPLLRKRPKKPQVKYCSTCRIYRSPRSHHCSTCNACCLNFDHHCPYSSTCIGDGNYRSFLTFIGVCTAYATSVVVNSVLGISHYIDSLTTDDEEILPNSTPQNDDISPSLSNAQENNYTAILKAFRSHPVGFLVILYAFVTFWFVFGLCIYHFGLCVINETTAENVKKTFVYSKYHNNAIYDDANDDYDDTESVRQRKMNGRLNGYYNPFDRGFVHNCLSVVRKRRSHDANGSGNGKERGWRPRMIRDKKER